MPVTHRGLRMSPAQYACLAPVLNRLLAGEFPLEDIEDQYDEALKAAGLFPKELEAAHAPAPVQHP